MSWGFFLELSLSLPTERWKQLANTTATDHAVQPGWFGLADLELERAYLDEEDDGTTLADAVAYFDGDGLIGDLEVGRNTTTLRVCQLVDRGGDTSIVKPIAAIFEGAKDVATGYIQLVNDGSYVGEGGVRLDVAGGKVTRARIADARPIAAQLSAALYPTSESSASKPASKVKSSKAKTKNGS